jgi:hypothetical protein
LPLNSFLINMHCVAESVATTPYLTLVGEYITRKV